MENPGDTNEVTVGCPSCRSDAPPDDFRSEQIGDLCLRHYADFTAEAAERAIGHAEELGRRWDAEIEELCRRGEKDTARALSERLMQMRSGIWGFGELLEVLTRPARETSRRRTAFAYMELGRTEGGGEAVCVHCGASAELAVGEPAFASPGKGGWVCDECVHRTFPLGAILLANRAGQLEADAHEVARLLLAEVDRQAELGDGPAAEKARARLSRLQAAIRYLKEGQLAEPLTWIPDREGLEREA